MPAREPAISLDSFLTFGDLLKYLRRRARLTQRELCIAVGYSEAQISRLEQNQRPPDLSALAALFIPALYLEDEPEVAARLMELAAQARGESLTRDGGLLLSRSVQYRLVETSREESTGNLPIALTSFIGRRREMEEITRLLDMENGKARLVTLTGSGGCGKTRLALEAGRGLVRVYRDGIWLVELASISDSQLVLQAVAATLGIPESRDAVPTSALTNYLRTRRILLILDNCEQIVAAVSQLVEEILRTCPQVQIVGTSREILNVLGEVQFRVPPLPLPNEKSSGGELSDQSEAVQLFVERARAVLPSFDLTAEVFPAVRQICHLVDGIPLGIELAAAKTSVLSVEQIAARLNDSFHLLGGGRASLPQHQTLEATIQWSYELLTDEERAVLQRLSVFSGGWTLEAAESVTGDGILIAEEQVLELLSALVNKSLVVVDLQSPAEARYRLLRIVRQYGLERLEDLGEAGSLQTRHLDFFMDLVRKAGTGLRTAQSPYWLKRLDAEQDNLRAALAYGQAADRYGEALELAVGLFWFWQTRGYINEGRTQLEHLLANFQVSGGKMATYARGLWAAGTLAWIQGDYALARARLEQSLSLHRTMETVDKIDLAVCLREIGIIAVYQGELDQARSFLNESIGLLQGTDRRWDLALAFYNQGLVFESQWEIGIAHENFDQSQSLFRELKEPWGLSVALFGLGRIAGRQGEFAAARRHLEESLQLSRKLDDPWSSASILYLLGEVSRLRNEPEPARKLYLESLALNRVVGDKAMLGFALHNLGKIAESSNELERAARLFGAAQALREDSNNTTSWSLTDHAQCEQDIASLQGKLEDKAFATAWTQGQALSLEDAVSFAST